MPCFKSCIVYHYYNLWINLFNVFWIVWWLMLIMDLTLMLALFWSSSVHVSANYTNCIKSQALIWTTLAYCSMKNELGHLMITRRNHCCFCLELLCLIIKKYWTFKNSVGLWWDTCGRWPLLSLLGMSSYMHPSCRACDLYGSSLM